jgi:hypothetical protein
MPEFWFNISRNIGHPEMGIRHVDERWSDIADQLPAIACLPRRSARPWMVQDCLAGDVERISVDIPLRLGRRGLLVW